MLKQMIRLLFSVILCSVIYTSFVLAESGDAVIDTSNAANGTISVAYTGGSSSRIKVVIEKGGESYSYDLNNNGTAELYPLQMGNGSYTVKVAQNTEGTKYATVQTATFDVALSSEFAPYLSPNQMVSYSSGSAAVKKAAELASGSGSEIDKANKIYEYVVNTISYDTDKAQSAQSGNLSGYVPNIDSVLSAQKGICFDYSAVFSAMMRSQNIPTRLVMGYVAPTGVYHAWNEVYIKEVGWVQVGSYEFDGQSWKIMDPTFTASSNNSVASIELIGNASNYAKKFQY